MHEDGFSELEARPYGEITFYNICGDEIIPPVIYWSPRREEIQRFVEIAKAVRSHLGRPRMLEIGCGTGFLSYLLAETGEVDVLGTDSSEMIIRTSPYIHPNLLLEVCNAEQASERYRNRVDVAVNSWMPYGIDLTPDIIDVNAKSIIYIRETEATGTESSYLPGTNYRNVFSWEGPAISEIQLLLSKTKDGCSGHVKRYNDNKIQIQIRKDIPEPKIPAIEIPEDRKYKWERELERLTGACGKIEKVRDFNLV